MSIRGPWLGVAGCIMVPERFPMLCFSFLPRAVSASESVGPRSFLGTHFYDFTSRPGPQGCLGVANSAFAVTVVAQNPRGSSQLCKPLGGEESPPCPLPSKDSAISQASRGHFLNPHLKKTTGVREPQGGGSLAGALPGATLWILAGHRWGTTCPRGGLPAYAPAGQ